MAPFLHRLPNELVIYIIMLTIDSCDKSKRAPRALSLSHVDRRLMALIHATPSLWTVLDVTLPSFPYPAPSNWGDDLLNMFDVDSHVVEPYKKRLEVLREGLLTYVAHAGVRLLNLAIDIQPIIQGLLPYTAPHAMTTDYSDIASSLDAGVFQYAGDLNSTLRGLIPRCRELRVSLPMVTVQTDFKGLLNVLATDAPHLQKLHVELNLDQYEAYDDPMQELVSDESALKLMRPSGEYRLEIAVCGGLDPREFPINWAAVTDLTLRASGHHFPDLEDIPHFIDTCLEILARCVSLEKCTIEIPLHYRKMRKAVPTQITANDSNRRHIKTLRSLNLINFPLLPSQFAACLDFPALENLTLQVDQPLKAYSATGTDQIQGELQNQFGSLLAGKNKAIKYCIPEP